MYIDVMLEDADLHPMSKEIIRKRYHECKVERKDLQGEIEITERTFYRRRQEGLERIRKIPLEVWQSGN